MVEATGGGVGWFDYDADGVLDLFFIQGGNTLEESSTSRIPDVLFRGQRDAEFVSVGKHGWQKSSTSCQTKSDLFSTANRVW